MFKGHPKGLYVAFFANMGERFGYYTMLAIFVLYLQSKFGWDATQAGHVYGGFLFGIYFLPLLGGFIADNILGYGKTIVLGIIVMFIGYLMLALPGHGEWFIYGALAVISLGTGLFKGNLQALVGNLYDESKYKKLRDSAFNIFYMGINIGAFFAPSAARAVRSWVLKSQGLEYDAAIPSLAHKYLNGTLANAKELSQFAHEQMGSHFTNLEEFSRHYIDALSKSYNAGFAVAALSMILSIVIFLGFRKYYKHADITHKQQKALNKDSVVELTPEQTKDRLMALGLVFLVVIFFWMAFHQNGFTLTIFARDYTVSAVNKATAVIFNLSTFLPVLMGILGIVLAVGKNNSAKVRLIGAAIAVGSALVGYYTISQLKPEGNPISPEIFQQFNPIFIVFMTPVIVGFFSYLRKRGKEPSSPKKIGIGMVITALGFSIMVLASQGLMSPHDLAQQGGVSPVLRSPFWLIGTYFTLTIAELFLSPIGISFVSQVAPPQYKGLAQGGWLGATAVGNLAAGLIGPFWDKWELWQFFALLVGLTLLSALFIFSILKLLERATNS
ncbi:peptide MFS transporter [Candidatus Sulfidibacterium hydrothermale]|uniref:peptide MFS transporter n=1 Tax=Candidatus Sulfidibacterium hydrothermale TaxID=2875962 RepID=UPI001F0A71CD|nr:peptide MFS transporter [Candidatus Sulfidibacterium hydrothermale]UBM61746.1 peptide MFS transporter [Candidatus Sulfidibacterium hydrothermale]